LRSELSTPGTKKVGGLEQATVLMGGYSIAPSGTLRPELT
jgi:hypothetical protein